MLAFYWVHTVGVKCLNCLCDRGRCAFCALDCGLKFAIKLAAPAESHLRSRAAKLDWGCYCRPTATVANEFVLYERGDAGRTGN